MKSADALRSPSAKAFYPKTLSMNSFGSRFSDLAVLTRGCRRRLGVASWHFKVPVHKRDQAYAYAGTRLHIARDGYSRRPVVGDGLTSLRCNSIRPQTSAVDLHLRGDWRTYRARWILFTPSSVGDGLTSLRCNSMRPQTNAVDLHLRGDAPTKTYRHGTVTHPQCCSTYPR
jgi:hypothetical protein